jgi:guanylate kinase
MTRSDDGGRGAEPAQRTRRGQLYVLSAPSGAGKTSLVRALLESRPALAVSVSHTTRRPRPFEVEGVHYFFVTPEQFRELVDRQAFLEHASVFDNFYGTGREQVEQQLAGGHDVLLEIDWQGARQIRKAMPACTTVFILPPSRAALEQRLRERRTDNAETIARRLADARSDMSHWNEFDYVVINDSFPRAALELQSILDGAGAALRATRPELKPLVTALLA